MKFVKNNTKIDRNKVASIAKELHLRTSVVELLFSRGITDAGEIDKFLHPLDQPLFDPFLLKDMDAAVDLINRSVKEGKHILILGDYDTDGICSTAILYKYFESIGVKCDMFLPNRMLDGYGLTIDTAKKVLASYSPDLIITVDCGISCHDEIEYIKSCGVDVIVTDHHEIPSVVPECIVIDPKLEVNRKNYPFCELCGAGVALKLVQALTGKTEQLYTTIAGIATVADMVPLLSENRTIVAMCLRDFSDYAPAGVLRLTKSLDIKKTTSTDISHKLAPRLNTAGRLADATESLKLFISSDTSEISNTIASLKSLNETRVGLCSEIFDECDSRLSHMDLSSVGAIVLESDNWNQGVIGIICARILEKYHRPVCLLTKIGDEYKGSIRSVPGINIFDALNHCAKYLVRFGGHEQAGGLAIRQENIEEFRDTLSNYILSQYGKQYFLDTKYYDLDYKISDISYDEIMSHEALAPFGFGNSRPVYNLDLQNIKFSYMKGHPEHLKYFSKDMEIVAFSASDKITYFGVNCPKSALVEFEKDTYTKSKKLKGRVRDFYFGPLNTTISRERMQASLVQYLKYGTSDTKLCDCDIKSLLGDGFGTLIISHSFDSYRKFAAEKFDVIYDLYTLSTSAGQNTVILAPENINISSYRNIVFLDDIGTGYYDYLTSLGYNVYVVGSSCRYSFSTNRGDIGAYYRIIISNADKITALDKYAYYTALKKLSPEYRGMKYDMFTFAVEIFSELGFLVESIDGGYKIIVSETLGKRELADSVTYSTMLEMYNKRRS